MAEWRHDGLDYALDKGIGIGGVLLSVLAAWFLVRFVAKRIEKWGDDGVEGMKTVREQRARTAAKLVRNAGRALLVVVAVLMVLNQLDVNISPLLASAGVVGLAVSFGSQSLVRDFVTWVSGHADISAPVLAALAHLEFVAIHPFNDGNGRTARAISRLAVCHG